MDLAQATLQSLVARGIQFSLRWERGIWIVRVGDYNAGLGAETRVRTLEEAVAFIEDAACLGTPGRIH